MPRQANAIDFWRGFALITIFINHVPGIFYERLTHRNFSISDSADLFVFLAGWSLRIVVGRPGRQPSPMNLVVRLSGRALTLYAAQILIIVVAIGMLAGAAIALQNPLLLEWHNAAAVFHDPVETHLGLALLTHHLGYFDILPLYVVLMLMAPGFALLDRYAPALLLPVSLAIYLVVLGFQITLPSWPVQGQWFFNPLAWQLIFVLGFAFARPDGAGGFARRHIFWIRIASIPIVVAGALVIWLSLWPDSTKVPSPQLYFVASKSYATPMRVIQFLALVALFSATYPTILRFAPRLVTFFSMLGRNSLNVFCVGSLLSLAGQIARFVYKGGIVIDTVVVVVGITALALTGWLSEWLDRDKARRQAAPAS
ncbi:MAG: OpgC domain-containing protein [Rhodospirillaceae bacterium]|nr:OpgC domain-containing protein [Rhodospirillaceae bacterium]